MTEVIEKVSNELVGRQLELDRLDAVLDVVGRGGSEVVLVGGEAGVGKTRLTRELTDRAKARGFQVAVGRCVEFGEEIWPLAPLREMVAGLASELDSEAFDLVIGNARGVLSRLVPEVGGEPTGDGPIDGGRLCELAVGVFRRLAKRGPLLLVVEDLHWADSSTRTLFSLLARAGAHDRVLLVGTYRSDELHRRHPLRPLLAEITRSARPERFDLEPLDRAGTAGVIAAIGSVAVDRALVDDIYRLSAGNPFFVEELVAARATGMQGFPETLRDVVLARAATLDETASEILRIAAAAGATVPEVIADAAGLDAASLATTIDVLVAAALLVPDGEEVRFRHELAREVFYGELAPGERASMHARLARCCETLRPDRPGDIARHWTAAHDLPRALVASIAAGRQALRTGAAAEAENHFGRVLELWSSVDGAETLAGFDHAALLSEVSKTAEYAGSILPAIDLGLRAANELAGIDPMREGKVWLQLRDLFRYCSRWDECDNAVERALALIPPSPPSSARADALANAAMACYNANRLVEATTFADEAVSLAEAAADRDSLVFARCARSAVFSMAGDFERQLSYGRETLALCDEGVSTERLLAAYNTAIGALENICRATEIIELAERGVEIARQTGLGGPRGTWLAHEWLGALVDLGRWDEAERMLAELQDLVGAPPEQANLAYTLGLALMRQGRLDEARPLVDYARGLLQAGHFDDEMSEMAAAVVEFDAREHRNPAAASFAGEMLERALRGPPPGAALLVFRAVAALADHCEAARAHSERDDVARCDAIASGLIDDVERALTAVGPRRFDDALDLERAQAELSRLRRQPDAQSWSNNAAGWESIGYRYEEAYARFRGAEALLAGTAGRSSSARQQAAAELTASRTIAESLHALPLLDEIDALARRARISLVATAPREQAPADNHFGLTARERDVLALVTEGRSNGEIAKLLFITTKTASVHVSNILRKLDVSNRVEAAALVSKVGSRPRMG